MKRWKLAVLSLCCVMLFTGCQPITTLLSQLTYDTQDAYKYQTEYVQNEQYNLLSAKEKEYYGLIYTTITEQYTEDTYVTFPDDQGGNTEAPGVRITLPGAKLSDEGIARIYEAFFADNPQFFYLDRTYSMEGRQSLGGESYYNTLLLRYTQPAEQRADNYTYLQQVVGEILANVPDTDDEYLVELYLHDQLNARCTYDMTITDTNSEASPDIYTAYGALIEGKAVCEGYAKAMQLLLQKVGITVSLITGSATHNNEAHMWNLVRINGEYYHLDPTWNDTNDQIQYTYFNLTTEMVELSCKIDEDASLPACTATKDNAFVRMDTLIDTYERQVIAQKIAARIQAGDTTIQLRFTEGKYENGVLFLKNQKLMSSMVNQYLLDTPYVMWDYTLWSEKEQSVLTLLKNE